MMLRHALTGVAQLVDHGPTKRRVTASNSGQSTYLGYRFRPQLGHVPEETDRCFFPSLSLSLPLSKNI